MANSSTGRQLIILDTKGVIFDHPVHIWKMILYPNAAADAATFVSWAGSTTPDTTMVGKTVTVTSSSILTSTGNFEAAEVSALDIINIYSSSTGNNKGFHLVLTRDSDNQITTSGSTLTDEVSSVYSWKIWTPYTSAYIKTDSTSGSITPWEIDYGLPGLWVPNLALQALSTSATVHLYVG